MKNGSEPRDIDPRARLAAMVLFVVAVVATPAGSVWPFVGYGLILAFLVGYEEVPLRILTRRLVLLLPLLAGIVILRLLWLWAAIGESGAARSAESRLLLLLVFRSSLGALAAAILLGRAGIDDISRALRGLGLPLVLSGCIEAAHRYAQVLGIEFQSVRNSASSRGFAPRHLGDTRTIGQLAGGLMLRSLARSERVSQAMLSRGFDGTLPFPSAPHFRARDGLFLAGVGAAAGAVCAASFLIGRI